MSTNPGNRPTSVTHVLMAINWVVLITAMFGGYALLGLISGPELGEFEQRWFRAGHAHAGVMVAIGVLYLGSLRLTRLGPGAQTVAWIVYMVGILAVSGGFFLNMVIGADGQPSLATMVLMPIGALLTALAVLYLAWQLIVARQPRSGDDQFGERGPHERDVSRRTADEGVDASEGDRS